MLIFYCLAFFLYIYIIFLIRKCKLTLFEIPNIFVDTHLSKNRIKYKKKRYKHVNLLTVEKKKISL